jgi:hypothetical protein
LGFRNVNCLDAETLAAWFDGGLKGAALEDARTHAAGCERCQMLLGAMGRTRAAVPASVAEPAARRWLPWAVPLAAAATAIAVWVAIPEQRNVPVTLPAAPTQQEAAAPRPAPATPESAPARARTAPAPSAPASARVRATLAPPRSAAVGSNQGAIASAAAQSKQAETAQAGGASAPAAPPPAALRAPAAESSAASDAQVLRSESVRTTAERASVPLVEMLCGAGWSAPPNDGAGALTAGSAPSPEVCWVVGRGGVIRRSTNRQTWQRVPFPQNTDLSAVRATDARSASVSTADGRTFSTSDGGMTWIQQ